MSLNPNSWQGKKLKYLATQVVQNKQRVTWDLWEAYPEEDKKALLDIFLSEVLEKARKENLTVLYYERILLMTDDADAITQLLYEYGEENGGAEHPYASELRQGIRWQTHFCIIKAYARPMDHTHITIP